MRHGERFPIPELRHPVEAGPAPAPLPRLLGWAGAAAAGRIGVALLAPFGGRGARERRLRAWRTRAARHATATLGDLKGVYAKAGQFAAHRHDLLPAEASGALAGLRDRVPPLPAAQIRRVVESELGAPLDRLFARFDPEPLGAASVAQVHAARLTSGREVAVKVQYPWLASRLESDLALLRGALSLWLRLSGRSAIRPRPLFGEFEAGLREELDFRREAAVAAEIRENLAGDDRVVVPGIVGSHSSRRVLTMEFLPAVAVTDREGLARLGVKPRDVLEIVARAYAKQVFVDGLFHADPHPGNLFVVDEVGAARRPRLLFVDFGLSRRLDRRLRDEMRRGIHALVRGDPDAFVAGMARMEMIAPGAETGVREAVTRMFERLSGHGAALALAGSDVLPLKDEAVGLLRETRGLQLPNDLLLFARTLATVFSLGRELDREVDLMRLALPYLLRFLAERE